MKIIKLNETQYKRLFEATDSTVGVLGVVNDLDSTPPSDINSTEISTNEEPGVAGPTADEFQSMQSPRWNRDGINRF